MDQDLANIGKVIWSTAEHGDRNPDLREIYSQLGPDQIANRGLYLVCGPDDGTWIQEMHREGNLQATVVLLYDEGGFPTAIVEVYPE